MIIPFKIENNTMYIDKIIVNFVPKYKILIGIKGIFTFLLYKNTAIKLLFIPCSFIFFNIGYKT